ncbi:hypothetical protein V6Z05_20010 [Leptospira venezuelensis]|uniref:hypothetical protein n=1 Tax=Leptospira venezuelensis TaxID=1958811 RepID=UPI000A373A74|nr:hypothetical protein [Leptospira venezuelensis]
MKNKIIGRSFKEVKSSEYYRLEIIDRGYYKYILSLFYVIILFVILSSFKEFGSINLHLCFIVTCIGSILIFYLFGPISEIRFIQVDAVGIVISSGLSYDPSLKKIRWRDVVEIDKVRYNYSNRHIVTISPIFYKFTLKNKNVREFICFNHFGFESEMRKLSGIGNPGIKINLT